jgi:tRNA (guanine37-N1)-methyltransferase
MKFDIITIFPKIFDSYFSESILKRAGERGHIKITIHNLRDFAEGKHKKVDDRPFGGGAGMVFMAEPILKAIDSLPSSKKEKQKVVILSAKGKQFNQKMAYTWAKKYDRIVFVSGRYEGIDERVKTALRAEEISMGPYVLTDGDVGVMAIVSAVARLLPGVIRLESLAEESHWNLLVKQEADAGGGGLEYPHYTRPEVLSWKNKKYRVPKILRSGDHKKIEAWRKGKTGDRQT